ncbi:hypothetical protein IAR50_000599 [Cryptococcus sp. DSM 104548]
MVRKYPAASDGPINQDKVILITGTSRGIGQGIAKQLPQTRMDSRGCHPQPRDSPKFEGNFITIKADQYSLTDFKDAV